MVTQILYLLFSISTVLPVIHAARIELPKGRQPEGVTHGRGSIFFAGDVRTGAISLVDTNSGLVSTVVPSRKNRTSLGLHAQNDLLFAGGGGTVFSVPAALYVYDIPTGRTVANCRVPDGFINDVVADKNYAYYTDSSSPIVHRLRLRNVSACHIDQIPLPEPAFSSEPGMFKANGIVKFAGGLIVVNSVTDTIYFIDLKNSNRAHAIRPEGSLPGADGLQIVRGKKHSKLYIAQNELNLVSVGTLFISKRIVSLKRLKKIRSKSFQFPTTVAVSGRTLVVANSRFDEVLPTSATNGTRFSVGVIRL